LDEELVVHEKNITLTLPPTFSKEGDDQILHLTVYY
jgi:hypothetical protein